MNIIKKPEEPKKEIYRKILVQEQLALDFYQKRSLINLINDLVEEGYDVNINNLYFEYVEPEYTGKDTNQVKLYLKEELSDEKFAKLMEEYHQDLKEYYKKMILNEKLLLEERIQSTEQHLKYLKDRMNLFVNEEKKYE